MASNHLYFHALMRCFGGSMETGRGYYVWLPCLAWLNWISLGIRKKNSSIPRSTFYLLVPEIILKIYDLRTFSIFLPSNRYLSYKTVSSVFFLPFFVFYPTSLFPFLIFPVCLFLFSPQVCVPFLPGFQPPTTFIHHTTSLHPAWFSLVTTLLYLYQRAMVLPVLVPRAPHPTHLLT